MAPRACQRHQIFSPERTFLVSCQPKVYSAQMGSRIKYYAYNLHNSLPSVQPSSPMLTLLTSCLGFYFGLTQNVNLFGQIYICNTTVCVFVKRFLFYGAAWSKSSLKDKWLVPCRLPAIKVEQNGQNKELEPTQPIQAKAQSCKRSPYVALSLKYANSHAYKLHREPTELCC